METAQKKRKAQIHQNNLDIRAGLLKVGKKLLPELYTIATKGLLINNACIEEGVCGMDRVTSPAGALKAKEPLPGWS
jgi:hypothetical protein